MRQGLHNGRVVTSGIQHRNGFFLLALSVYRLAHPAVALFPALCILFVGSCISQTHTPYRGSELLKFHEVASLRRPEGTQFKIFVEPAEGTHTHALLRLFRPKPCGDSELELGALAYLSRKPGAKRWVVVLPIWGSSTYPPNRIVRKLLSGNHGRETNVLWIQGPARLVRYAAFKKAATEAEFVEEVSRTASCIEATTEDVRTFLDWVMEQPETDPRRVAIVGFSIGAIVGSLVMGRDPRLAAGVLVMVGGHLDEIVAHCKWGQGQVREHAAAAFGWKAEKFKYIVKEHLLPVDPVLAAGRINPAAILYIDAGYDKCIPQSCRDDLWRAMGEPERVTLGYDHRNSFLTMTFLGFDVTTRRIIEFLNRRLADTNRLLPDKTSTTTTEERLPSP